MNDRMERNIYELNLVLNDIAFNTRMANKNQREFIKEALVDKDLEYVKRMIELNKEAYNNHEKIIVTSKKIDGKFESEVLSPNSENYESEYIRQSELLNSMIITCDKIKDYLAIERQTDDIMVELYSSLGIDMPTDENEETEVLTIEENPETAAEIDRILNDNQKNSNNYETKNKPDESHEKKPIEEAEELIKNLNEKRDVLKKRSGVISRTTYEKTLRIKKTIDEISDFYDKFEIENGFKTVTDLDRGIDYISSDLENDITFLNNSIEEYKEQFKNKKPIAIYNLSSNMNEQSKILYNNIKIFTPENEDYEDAYKYMCTEMELAATKGEALLTKYFQKTEANKPDMNYAMEVMFNEVKYTLKEIEESIKNNESDYNDSTQKLWLDSSIVILNYLKSSLKQEYRKGNPIRLASINEKGMYVVDEVENSEENYNRQLDFLDKAILECQKTKTKMESKIEKKSSEEDEKKKGIDKKHVVVVKDDKIIVIGVDITEEDVENIDSPILEEAKKKNQKYSYVSYSKFGIYKEHDVIVKIDMDGNIIVEEDVEKAEFHNQREMYLGISEAVGNILHEYNTNGDISKVERQFKAHDPNLIWKEIGYKIAEGKMSVADLYGLKKYLKDNFGEKEIASYGIIPNDEYEHLMEKYKDAEIEEKPSVKKGRRVKKRSEKKGLIQKFKELKTWKKVAIIAGLSIAGIAIVGTGIYHLVPGVRPMIDGFIQGINPANIIPGHVNEATRSGNTQPIQPILDQLQKVMTNPDTSQHAASISSSVPNISSVDYSSIGTGHTIFSDAFRAVTGDNPQIASQWFSGNPLDVFNTSTNQFMHLTSEQLHDAEFLRNLANDPNNAMLFGNSMQDADGFISLTDIIGEIVKGGKVL